jgi:hypothetical protein
MRCIVDFFETRVRNLLRTCLLPGQLERFRRSDDQRWTFNLLQRWCPVHAKHIGNEHAYANVRRRFHPGADQSFHDTVAVRFADNRLHHTRQIFLLVRLINGEHFELLRRFLGSRDHALGAIRNCRVHQHNSREILGAVALNKRSDVLNPLRPSNENWVSHAQAFQQRMQILRTNFRGVSLRGLRRFALRTRIERDDAMGFCECVDLMLPNIPACAPARNKK